MLEILDATSPDDYERWIQVWAQCPHREVFGHPGYVRLYSSDSARPLCALWQSADGTVLYPFLLRSFQGEPFWNPEFSQATDITSPYGYGGAFAWGITDRKRLAEQFWAEFDRWAHHAHVVSEFVRFSLFPDTLLDYPGLCEEKLDNVVRDLEPDDEALWMDVAHKVRKNVKKAHRSGIGVELDATGERLSDFLGVYYRTMGRRGAGKSYYFSERFFERIITDLPGQFMFFHAVHEERVVSTELVLVSAENVYSFLGGTEEDAFDLRPNDLLKYEIILWARKQGKRRFVLGGGYEGEDGIFGYKLGFAPSGRVAFSVGKRVLQPELYDQLVANHMCSSSSEVANPRQRDFFPAYRA